MTKKALEVKFKSFKKNNITSIRDYIPKILDN
jgi:hypothetical protein